MNTPSLTDAEINNRIAVILGRKECPIHHSFECCSRGRIPNYAGSLDAIHECEKLMTPEQAWEYSSRLKLQKGENPAFPSCWEFHATARQRAQAFLEVMG